MASTVADVLIQRLAAWGVGRIYGYPGDGINGLTSARRCRRISRSTRRPR